MADEAITNTQIEVFLDEVRSKLSGAYNYEPVDSTEKWVYAEVAVNNVASADLLSVTAGDTSAYPTYMGTSDVVASGDTINWIAIKNTTSTATTGLLVSLDGGDCAYGTADNILIGAGELCIIKCPLAGAENASVLFTFIELVLSIPAPCSL